MLRYAITDGAHSSPDADARRTLLRAAVRRWFADGVDFIQLREKQMPVTELIGLCQELVQGLRQPGSRTRLLVSGRADIALASRADGVHLTAAPGELTPEQVRTVFARAGAPSPLVSVSCHTPEDAARAHAAGATLILFGPVFEKVVAGSMVAAGSGLDLLRQAVVAARTTPLLALGGMTARNIPACLEAGAAGVAGIRLFSESTQP